jgi:TP901 family phage tail tape measure protein
MARSDLTIEIQAKVRQAVADLQAVNAALGDTGKSVDSLDRQLEDAQQSFEQLRGPAIAALGAVTGAATGASAAWASYQREMVQVQNITEASGSAMGELSREILGLDSHLGEADDLMRGLYQTISSGITDSDDAFKVLTSSAMSAKGNFADLTTTVDAATSFLNAYGLEAGEVDMVLDSMTRTVDIGKLTFQELADNVGKGVAVASAANVSYQELMATMATLTLNGLSVEEAMTAIRNILRVMVKPSEQEAKAMADIGLEMDTAALAGKGLGGVMAEVAKKVEGSATATALLFPNIRAMMGAMQLATDKGANQLRDSLDEISNSAGKSASNFARSSQTMVQETEALTAEVKKLGIEFGQLIAEDITPGIRKLTEFTGVIRDLDRPSKELAISIGEYTAAFAAFVLIAPVVIRGMATIAGAAGVTAGALTLLAAAGAAAVLAITEIGRQYETAADRQMHASIQQEQQAKAMSAALQATGADWQDMAENMGLVDDQGRASLQMFSEYIRKTDGLATSNKKLGDIAREYQRQLVKLNRERSASINKTEEQAKAHDDLMAKMEGLVTEADEVAGSLDGATRSTEALTGASVLLGNTLEGQLVIALDRVKAALERQALAEYALWEGARTDFGLFVVEVGDGFDDIISDAEDWHLVLQGIGAAPPDPFLEDWRVFTNQVGEDMRDTLAHAIGQGLASGFEDFDFEDVIGDLAGMMGDVLGEGISAVMQGQSFGDAFGFILGQGPGGQPLTGGQRLMGTLGGAAMMYQGYQQGGAEGALSGVIGGAMVGGQYGGVVGAVIGGIVGGITSLFGGDEQKDEPFLSMRWTQEGGWEYMSSQGMGLSGVQGRQIERRLQDLWDTTYSAWIDTLGRFDMASISGLVGTAQEGFDPSLLAGMTDREIADYVGEMMPAVFHAFATQMSPDELIAHISEEWLPQQMELLFRNAIDAGLAGFGVTADRLDEIWDAASGLEAGRQAQFLTNYVNAVVDGAELLGDLDWSSIMESVAQTPRQALMEALGEGLGDLDTMLLSMEHMNLEQQVQRAGQVQELASSALGSIVNYLRQIDQLSKQLERGISQQIEGLRLTQMSEMEQAQYFATQIGSLFDQLAVGGLDPSQVAMMTQDAQSYISALQQLMGDDAAGLLAGLFRGGPMMGEQPWLDALGLGDLDATTGTDFLIALLEHLQGLSQGALDDAAREAEDLAQQYQDRVAEMQDILIGTTATFGETDVAVKSLNTEFDRLTGSSLAVAETFERIAASGGLVSADALAAAIAMAMGAAAMGSARRTATAPRTPGGLS